MMRGVRGNGSVSKLPSGKWLGKFPLGRYPNERTCYRSRKFATKTDAERWRSSMIAMRENNMLVAGPRQTLRQYANSVLLNQTDQISDRTRDGYLRHLRNHVFPVLGSVPLTEIRPQALENLFSHIRKSHSVSFASDMGPLTGWFCQSYGTTPVASYGTTLRVRHH